MNNGSQKISEMMKQQTREAVGKAVQGYMSIAPEKRQELEQNGINFSDFIFDAISPVMYNTRMKDVLIVMEEGIGNMVMLTPALKMLRAKNPRLNITVWGKEPAVQVIRGWDVVDRVITEFDDGYYDICMFSMWSQTTKQRYKDILQQHCKVSFEIVPKVFHEIIQQNGIAEFFDGQGDIFTTHCQISSGEEAKAVDVVLKDKGVDKFIVFGDTTLRNFGWERKRWPHYVGLAKIISNKFKDYKIILIGDKEDKDRVANLEWPDNVIFDFMGELSIPQLAYLLTKCELYVGNDTGPTHIAAAVGARTYAIFGGTRIHKNKPLGKNVHVITKGVSCSPCQYTERWDKCDNYMCMDNILPEDVYNTIFYPQNNEKKKKVLLVGDFSQGAHRNEIYIRRVLEEEFKLKVIPFDYRAIQRSIKNQHLASMELLNAVVDKEPDLVLICGGQGIIPNALSYISVFSPKTKIANWYVDQRGGVEPWFKELSMYCHNTYWSTGDPNMLSNIFSQTQKPCTFLPISLDDKSFYPTEDAKKDIDVLFIGNPTTNERVMLFEYLVSKGIKLEIRSNSNWPPSLKSIVKDGVFDKELNRLLNRAKIVLNINTFNNIPLYFSDRIFFPMATKTASLCKQVPRTEDMFKNNEFITFVDNEDCYNKIVELLADEKLRETIASNGYATYKEKYTLTKMVKVIVDDAELGKNNV
ncbi:glycosyltransferase [Candidatus Dojkabacteria bacterium]|jgi:ADP-heptose:LPS heptosyltransferase|nr:glycosyltransferase [Candidatus Dojkabacteria bacterium]